MSAADSTRGTASRAGLSTVPAATHSTAPGAAFATSTPVAGTAPRADMPSSRAIAACSSWRLRDRE